MDLHLLDEHEGKFWCGILKIRELPEDWTEEQFKLWWPRFSEKERERYTAYEARNILTLSGFQYILTYVANPNANTAAFSQYFAVGTFPIVSVFASDTSVNTEFFSKAPTSNTITGNQLTLSTLFATTEGNTTYTNAGLYGNNATSTSGSGVLMTHTLYSYTKTSAQSISNDYIITLQ